jgi:hypothetical protein
MTETQSKAWFEELQAMTAVPCGKDERGMKTISYLGCVKQMAARTLEHSRSLQVATDMTGSLDTLAELKDGR